MTLSRRSFLGAALAVIAAPSMSGFRVNNITRAIESGFINVVHYGADIHGLSDSADAFRYAIDAAMNTGRTVYVPAGVYRMR